MNDFFTAIYELRAVIAFCILMAAIYIGLCARAAQLDKAAAMRQHPAGGRFGVEDYDVHADERGLTGLVVLGLVVVIINAAAAGYSIHTESFYLLPLNVASIGLGFYVLWLAER